MYFIASKTLGFFLVPSNLIACVALLGLVLMHLRKPIGKKLAIVALAVFTIAALSPLGNMILVPLEQRFPYMRFPEHPIEGIIVLGGSYDTHAGYIATIVLNEDTEPMAVVANLAHRYPEAKIIFSGGTASLSKITMPSEAEIAKKLFISFGVDPRRILVEDQSRTTEENAVFSARLLNPTKGSRWLLVTNAFHMSRSVGSFRRAGFSVIGFAVGWRTHGWRDFFWPTGNATENLRRVDVATHEWIGLSVYRVLGYTTNWLPGN